jgi:subfamily B ATP-binding cassette protein MsbA
MNDWQLYRRLIGYVRPYRTPLIVATIAMVAVAGTNSAVPMFVQPLMDDIFVGKRADMLLPIALGVLALFTVKGLAVYLQAYLMGRIGHRVIADLRHDLQRSLVAQDLAFFTARPAGEIVSRLTYDTTQIQQAVTRALTAVFQHIFTIIGLTVVLFVQNWRLAAIAVVALPLAFRPLQIFGRAMRRQAQRGQAGMGRLSSLLYELVGGIRAVKIFRMENTLGHRVRDEIDALYETFRRTVRVEAASSPIMEWIGALGVAGVLLIGGRWVIDGTISTGSFFSFTAAALLLYDPIRRMNGTWQEIQRGVAAAERIFDWLDMQPSIRPPQSPRTLPAQLDGGLRFEGVSFAYGPDAPSVLQGIDLDVGLGEVIALVGPSGGGKSTLADLVPRFLDPTAGRITLGGIDLRELDPADLRDRIAMVDQHTVLFDDDVRRNLRYGRESASDADIEEAAKAAYADAFIRALPAGYDTQIGEDGVVLSGGQRQRLAIARALLKDAPILILDEATSALDSESEREVQKALDSLLAGRTALVIAHRLSTIRHADRIVVLEAGRIVDQGTHDELLSRGGLYARLQAMQAGETG